METEETAGINWNNYKSKLNIFFIIIPISNLTFIDIRYILYIINQCLLFNSELKPYQKNIQVGGRRLYLKRIDIIIIKLINKKFIFLKNNLFIFNLEYIFVLTKKLVGNQFIDQFNCYKMQFLNKLNNILIIKIFI